MVLGAIRRLLALPLVLGGRLLALLDMPQCAALYKAAWLVGDDGEVATRGLQALSKHLGPEHAALAAEVWMQRRASSDVGAFAGILALNQEQFGAAADWLARAKQVGPDALGHLEVLEFLLAMRSGPEAANELAQRFAQRHDLPPGVSKLLFGRLMWDDLLAGRVEDARRRALRVLAIEDDRDAACILWALAERQGRHQAAQAYLRRGGNVSPATMLYFRLHAAVALDLDEQVQRLLAELDEADPQAAQAARQNLAERQAHA